MKFFYDVKFESTSKIREDNIRKDNIRKKSGAVLDKDYIKYLEAI